MRLYAAKLLGFEEDEDAELFCVCPDRVAYFNRHKFGGPTNEEFALDFTDTVNGLWNREAVFVFSEGFVDSKLSGCKDLSQIRDAFKSHFQTLKKNYERQLQLQEPYGHVEVEKQQSEDAQLKRKKNVSLFDHLARSNSILTFTRL